MSQSDLANSSINQYQDSILESISDGVFTVDHEWRITSFNRAAEEITGMPRSEAIGRLCSEVFRSSMCESECALRETLGKNLPLINKSCFIINALGERIPISVSTAVLRDNDGKVIGGAETFRDLSEVEALRKELECRFQVGDLVSHSPSMRKVFDLLPAVSGSSSTVLIQGETGTGKEVVARTIHSMSNRADAPFIAVNCGALPDSLLESELFGYKKGAFTGATQDKAGRFTLADKGTIFLDEIGDITPALQVRLLRVLQEKSFMPLGGTAVEHTEARVIAATNRDLLKMVSNGEFREDLFYRINVVKIELPPLSQRKEDIPLLVDYFVQRFNRLQQKNISGVAPEVLSLLMAHNWPGNVRELENIIERAFVLCDQAVISLTHLPEEMIGRKKIDGSNSSMGTIRNLTEKKIILNALQKNQLSPVSAAKELGIHKTTLYRKMKKLGINLPSK